MKTKIKKILSIGIIMALFSPPLNFYLAAAEEKSADAQNIIKQYAASEKPAADYVSDEVIVKFKPEVDLKKDSGKLQAAKTGNASNLEKKEDLKPENLAVFKIKDGKSVDQKIEELQNNPQIDYVQPNFKYKPATISADDTYKDYLWALDNTGQTIDFGDGTVITGTADADMDAPEAWAVSEGNENQTIVAVIDDGVNYAHVDLAANMWDGAACKSENNTTLGDCISGYDYENSDKNPAPNSMSSDDAHGTFIAGMIGAVKNNTEGAIGLAPHAEIMAIKFDLTTAQAIKAVNFAKYNGAKVINASWVGDTEDPALTSAISSFDGLFITAAGNDSQNIDSTPVYPCASAPANIICVAGTDQNDLFDSVYATSNYGATTVDVAAPGSYILSTAGDDSYLYGHGTSFSTAYVSGLAALIWGYRGSSLDSAQVKNVINGQGDTLASLSSKTISGKRINAYSSLSYLSSAKLISSFAFTSPEATGVIDNDNHTIAVTVPYGTSPSSLTPTVTFEGASVSPASGVAQDFSSPVTYTVTALDSSTLAYTVTVTVALNSAKQITSFGFASPVANGSINQSSHTISVTVPKGTNKTSLVPTIVHTGASVSPDSGVAQDFTNPVVYTVTAENSTTQTYTVTVSIHKNSSKKKSTESKRGISTSPKKVLRGHVLTETGKKFSKNSKVALYFSKSPSGPYYNPIIVTTDSKGKFKITYKVPMNKQLGKYKWYAVNLKTGWKSKVSTYTVK